ncbi:MAG: riboflavin synthase [Opitutae bacterium]|nr:riboflavin synthase [Opitutae bacterium]
MFTGIIEEVGQVAAFAPGAAAWSLRIAARLVPSGLARGDSVAVNGCCLTVTQFDADQLGFDVLEETRRLTNFRELAVGAAVNLERSLQPSGRMGGHFVTGHIDALGTVEVFEPRGKDHYLRVKLPAGIGRYLVAKGSVALDGISLTVAEVAGDSLAVWLIPHTLAATNLREKRTGSGLNVEVDLLAKYVEKLLPPRPA